MLPLNKRRKLKITLLHENVVIIAKNSALLLNSTLPDCNREYAWGEDWSYPFCELSDGHKKK